MFDFVFTLFGLLLGLSLAEVLGGYARAMRARTEAPVGILTPMLGLLVMFDLITFWAITWLARDQIVVANLNLYIGFLITGVYYLAATSIFPGERPPGDYDAHYFRIKRKVILAILFCNLATYAALTFLFGRLPPRGTLLVIAGFVLLYVAALVAKKKGTSVLLLALLLLAYVVEASYHYPPVPGRSA
jgi:hypothetical protein